MKIAAASLVLGVCVLAASACGKDSSPLNPSGSDNVGALHVSVDGTTCAGLGPVSITIDGTNVGNASPGGGGITKEVSVGQHFVGGRANNYPDVGWTPSQVNVPRAGFTYLLHC